MSNNTVKLPQARTDKSGFVKKYLARWEVILFLILIIVNVFNALISPYYSVNGILGATRDFMDKTFIVFPMAMVILIGEIDISVAATVALSSVMMGVTYNAGNGVPMVVAILIGLGTATICGFINGLVLTKFKELSPMIVTLATQTMYRGLAYVILEDQAAGSFPMWFQYFGWGSIGPVPFILICFVVCAVIFTLILNKSKFGRRVYAIGNNREASRFSGINVERTRLIIYTLTGAMAGITAIFLTSRMSSTRPNIALMYELDIISMVVLGGISTSGGKGRISGAIISIFIVGLLRYGLGLINISSQVLMIIIGLLLVISVMTPNVAGKFKEARRQRLLHKKVVMQSK